MKRRAFAVVVAAFLAVAAPSRASLTPSESEQVRRGVATASDIGRVRALVARPDLSADEAAAAMVGPLTTTALDPPHASFLHELVFAEAAGASRPVLVVATWRGLLARADALIAQHGLDLERSPAALAELQLVYAWAEQVALAGPAANVPDSAREPCARALADHVARNAAVLSPQAAVGPHVAGARAQAAVALLDLLPATATRRIDAADALALTGSRRAFLVERGVRVLDAGGADARVATVRALFERLPALHDGLEVIMAGGPAAGLSARDGAVMATGDDPGGNVASMLLWGSDVRSPPSDGWAAVAARALATEAVSRALARSDALRAQVERDGGLAGVAALTAMLVSNGPLSVETSAARLLSGATAGRAEATACLADAIGALAVFAPGRGASPPAVDVTVGPAKTAGPAETQLTRVSIGPAGAATGFRLEGHAWRFQRDAAGRVTGLERDGIPVSRAMLAAAR